MNDSEMLDTYDFSKSIRNPYSKKLKKPITIRLESDTIDYFKDLATSTGIPYQSLMNMFLADCAKNHKQLEVSWK